MYNNAFQVPGLCEVWMVSGDVSVAASNLGTGRDKGSSNNCNNSGSKDDNEVVSVSGMFVLDMDFEEKKQRKRQGI